MATSAPASFLPLRGDDGLPGDPRQAEISQAGYPLECEALLIVELDGRRRPPDRGGRRSHGERQPGSTTAGPQSEQERLDLLGEAARRLLAGSVTLPDYYCMDGTIRARNCRACCMACESCPRNTGCGSPTFHAGDGNLHPLILYDANSKASAGARDAFGLDILRLCVQVGGVLTGEHGVGVENAT